MRKIVFIVSALLIIFIGCASDKDLLRQRAIKWHDLTVSVDSMVEETALTSISQFLEPSAANSDRAREYYKDWTNPDNAKELDYSIDDITIADDKEHATVTYTFVLSPSAGGERKFERQLTFWKKVNGQWYRTLTPNL